MATIAKVDRTVFGNKRVVTVDVTFSASYTTGGESFTATNVGLRKIISMDTQGAIKSDNSAMFLVNYDATNNKLLLYAAATASATVGLKEATNGQDYSTYVARVQVTGY